MQNLLNNFKDCFLNIYLIAPFIFAGLLSIFTFIKNPVFIRIISKIFFFITFFFSIFLFFNKDITYFSFLNTAFLFSSSNCIFLAILSVLAFFVSLISKMFIFKMQKRFFIFLSLIYGFLNLFILIDNVLSSTFSFISLFFISYLLYLGYLKNDEDKKHIYQQLIFDIVFFSVFLIPILWVFKNYFSLKLITLTFFDILQNINYINPLLFKICFFCFLILIFKLFNLIPFSGKNIYISNKINPFISTIINASSFITGGLLIIKIYPVFFNLFYHYRKILSIFLIINFGYYIILSFRKDSLIKFANCVIAVLNILCFYNLFLIKNGLTIYSYSLLSNVVSYLLLGFCFTFLIQENETDNILKLKKINPNNKILSFFILVSCLNICGIPFLCVFLSRFYMFINIFSTIFSDNILNIIPVLLIIGCFILTINMLNIMQKIFIALNETIEKR